MSNSFEALTTLKVGGNCYRYFDIKALSADFSLERLPFSIKILLENLLRKEDGFNVTTDDIRAVAGWRADVESTYQFGFTPARVVLQDFTGVPAVVDLAAMRAAMRTLNADPAKINPQCPVDLVIDHSVMVDVYGSADALATNTEIEFQRNQERYQFLRWGQQAFNNFRVVPPGTGIVHQVNLEYLANVVMTEELDDGRVAFPDTLVGTDSHTTMINGLGVLGWGVGGIEAEAAMLGQPITMLIPEVVGFKLTGRLPEGATATDLVLTVTQMLRQHGVVGKFVEFHGDGLDNLPLADRATIANMAPEYGATCGIFPIDQETIRYLELSGREPSTIALVEAYAKAQGMWRQPGEVEADYSSRLVLDLGTVEPCLAGPKRPQDRILLRKVSETFDAFLTSELDTQSQVIASDEESRFDAEAPVVDTSRHSRHNAVAFELNGVSTELRHGAVVIAAITSCTNTSNPAVMLAAGLVAKKALEKGLKVQPWVKTSLAPGSQVVPAYLEKAGLLKPLAELGFDIVGFGCTTCIGNSGPLAEPIEQAIRSGDLVVASVLSGNRNFEGRIHAAVRSNFLASPPLVVAYALAGNMSIDLSTASLGADFDGNPVFLRDIWPSQLEIGELIAGSVSAEMYRTRYGDVFTGSEAWQALPIPADKIYSWPDSTYVRQPTFFDGMPTTPPPLPRIHQARCLVKVGHSITTDHISPAGAIKADSPAGRYLQENGVDPADFNSYGSRRGNHEVMVRGTFANVRLRNQLAPGTEGGWTTHYPGGEQMTIFDAAMDYQRQQVPLIVLAGEEYGTGSSRDWAAKGTNLLGIRAVIAESFERIHRSNLVGFGVLPLQFQGGDSCESLGLQGDEVFDIQAVEGEPATLTVTATSDEGKRTIFTVDVRIDTAVEWHYYRHGGILHYVLRQLSTA
jgi:aconitate hydratase A / 2-methylisocitrate dehydratase